jgi:pimeloyl-ACP methyl ester carboxylesterase
MIAFSATGWVTTPVLDVANESAGDAGAIRVILLHGVPYDVRAFDGVATILADGAFVLAPYLRGFGPTRFRDHTTMGPDNKPRSPRTCSTSWTHWTSTARSRAATPGEAELRAYRGVVSCPSTRSRHR